MFSGKDQGVNVRHKCTDMIDFIQDDDRLREERKKAKKNKDKYVGMSSDSMGSRSRGFGGFGGFDSGGSRYDFKSKFVATNIFFLNHNSIKTCQTKNPGLAILICINFEYILFLFFLHSNLKCAQCFH